MQHSIDHLRRQAKTLRKAWETGDPKARDRVARVAGAAEALPHAKALHVIARENGFDSWPKLKLAVETAEMDRAARRERLKIALFHGQNWVVDALLAATPDLADGAFELEIALGRRTAVLAALERDPGLATKAFGPRRPILHLAFSGYLAGQPERHGDAVAIGEALIANGADVNDGYPFEPGAGHMLSALYGALGHARNLPLARWLLENGADPNDNESLYHATELGHHEGLEMLLAHGADPAGTNALLRAMDFNDHRAVEMLLTAGADPNEGIAQHPSGAPPTVASSLHQAARRMSDARMVEILLAAGADWDATCHGLTAYELARCHGNAPVAGALARAGADTAIAPEIEPLVAAADGATPGDYINPDLLPDPVRNILRDLVAMPGALDHMRRLVAAGLEYDRPDEMGLTPVQLAGWEGLPDAMAYFLSLKPDLSHINAYGGTLLSTIIHGSENCPARAGRDHIACARLALEEGVALPQPAIDLAGTEAMAAFLSEWGADHPGQVTPKGIG